MAFTCPRCSRTSHSPADAAQGYCGACGAWTGEGEGVTVSQALHCIRERDARPQVERISVELALADSARRRQLGAALESHLACTVTFAEASRSLAEAWARGGVVAFPPSADVMAAREQAVPPYDTAEGDDGPEPDTYPWDCAAAWHPGYPPL